MKVYGLVLALALLFVAPAVSLPCSSMGPNTHAGRVAALDAAGGTLALIDAESGKSILFNAPPALLASLRLNDRVVIRFKTEKKQLVAEEIHA